MTFSYRFQLICLAALCACTIIARPQPSGDSLDILPTPPLGFDIWYLGGPNFTEDTIKRAVDIASTNGLVELGWTYVMITDGWQGERVNGYLQPDPAKIPNITNLINYIHSRGMKAGIYSEPTARTSVGEVGSGGYIEQDAAMFASWGIDYVQFDMGLVQTDDDRYAYAQQFINALRAATPRPVGVYTTGFRTIRPEALGLLNCMRITDDFGFGPQGAMGEYELWTNYLDHLDASTTAPQLVGPGHWMHTDHTPMVLPFPTSNRAYFSMKAIIASPIFSDYAYLPSVDPYGYTLFTNREIINIHQDRLGRQGQQVWRSGDAQIWSKMLADGSRSVAFLNRSTNKTEQFTLKWEDIGLRVDTRALVRDCWLHADVGVKTGSHSMSVARMSAEIFRITPLDPDDRTYIGVEWKNDRPEIILSGQLLNYGVIERSTDLRQWTRLGRLKNTTGTIRFTGEQATMGPTFYRGVAE